MRRTSSPLPTTKTFDFRPRRSCAPRSEVAWTYRRTTVSPTSTSVFALVLGETLLGREGGDGRELVRR